MTNVDNNPVRSAWEKNAKWWSNRFGEGNDFHLQLIAPPVEKLLTIQHGERILDIACGNGAFSRRMADLGARVTAFDFSEPFIECARERSEGYADRIEYRVIDATDREQLLELGRGCFDGAIANMALMETCHRSSRWRRASLISSSQTGASCSPSCIPASTTTPCGCRSKMNNKERNSFLCHQFE